MHLWFVHWNFRFFIFRGRRRVEDELRVDRLHFVVVTRPDPDPNAAIVVVVVVVAVVVVVVDTRRRRRRRPIRVLSRCDDDVGVSSRSSLLNVDDRRRLVLGAAAASGNAHDDDTTEREQKKTISLLGLLSSFSLSLDDAARKARSKKEVPPRKEKGKKNGEETFVLKWKHSQSKKKGGCPRV